MDEIYNPSLSLELAGGNQQLADQMFDMLLKELPVLVEQMNDTFAASDMEAMQGHVHKINGSTRYCGVPALYEAAHALERYMKSGESDKMMMQTLVENVNTAISDLLEYKNS